MTDITEHGGYCDKCGKPTYNVTCDECRGEAPVTIPSITEQAREAAEAVTKWYAMILDVPPRKSEVEVVAGIISEHVHPPSVTEAIDCVKRLRDEWAKAVEQDLGWTPWVNAANKIITALSTLQGKAGVNEPVDEALIRKAAAQTAQDLYAAGWLRAQPKKVAEKIVASLSRHIAAATPASVEAPQEAGTCGVCKLGLYDNPAHFDPSLGASCLYRWCSVEAPVGTEGGEQDG